ncbi:hypothetical protein [Cyclobacterium qasimii]|nr:hypothetical protein [Cyclobacterium qasimii]
MKNILLLLLVILALGMIIIGIIASMLPPALTGVGFLIIAALFFNSTK